MQDSSHRRKNLLTGEWVLVSPHRTERPWQGQEEDGTDDLLPRHDPDCYLCPGNERADGQLNPDYAGPWAVDNDFPALTPHVLEADDPAELFQAVPESGQCRVVCYTERHDLGLWF